MMNFQQFRSVVAAVRHGLNLTEAAGVLSTSQSSVSKQIHNLEAELGIQIFNRKGKRLTGITEAGIGLIDVINHAVLAGENVKRYAEQFTKQDEGRLVIGATHNQAVNALPHAVKRFAALFPKVTIEIRQSAPSEIAQLVSHGVCDIAVSTEAVDDLPELVTFPYYSWRHVAIVANGHPLAEVGGVTLEDLARYPLVTYGANITGRAAIDAAFHHAKLTPEIRLTATEADVIKRYTALGLGVGLVAETSVGDDSNQGITILPSSRMLFEQRTAKIAVRKERLLRSYALSFVRLLAPHLTDRAINDAIFRRKMLKHDDVPSWATLSGSWPI